MTTILRPVILCGGAGTRLWPLSRKGRPKQLLALTADLSLLQLTALRTQDPTAFAPPLVVTSEQIAADVAAQLKAVGVLPQAILVEPVARNTAPAIALAAHEAGDDDILIVMPSDHSIGNQATFRRALGRATELAAQGWIVTLGMEPTGPETGYGYIAKGKSLGEGAAETLGFVEKPSADTAEQYVASGRYLWNGGIFVFCKAVLLKALSEHAPQVYDLSCAAAATAVRDGLFVRPSDGLFEAMPSISIDYAVMEHANRIAVVPVEMGWSDVGSWDALNELIPADEGGNRLKGNVLSQGARHCSIHSNGPVVVAIGVENLTIVATGDAILIMPAGQSHRLSEAVKVLQAKGSPTLD